MPDAEPNDFIKRLQVGDQAAQAELEQRMLPLLIHLVRRRRSNRLQARIGSEDVANAALKSFLTGIQKNEFPALSDPDSVLKILTTLVLRSLQDRIRLETRQRRDVRREESYEVGVPEHLPENAVLAGSLAFWLEDLGKIVRPVHPLAIEIVELSVKGLSNVDIADQLNLSPRYIEVLKKRMRERYQSQSQGET